MADDRDRARLRALSRPNPWRWLAALALHWAGIVAALVLARAVGHWAVYLLVVPFVGVQLNGIAVLGHDGAHWNITRDKRLNDLLAHAFCFLPFGFHLKHYRKWHLGHHAHLGEPEDPELQTIKRWLAFKYRTPIRRWEVVRRACLGLLGAQAGDLLVFSRLFGPKTAGEAASTAAFFAAAAAALVAFDLLWVALVVLFSMVCVIPVLNYVRTVMEHSGSPATHRLRLGPVMRAVFGPHHVLEYHFEHHAWPSIPFYNLPAARGLERDTPIASLPELWGVLAGPSTPGGESRATPSARRRRERRRVRADAAGRTSGGAGAKNLHRGSRGGRLW